jgi:hypothetical protein
LYFDLYLSCRKLLWRFFDDSDEEGEGEALLEHEDHSSSESESSSTSDQEEGMDNYGGECYPIS